MTKKAVEDNIKPQLQKAEKFLDKYHFKKAWELLEPLIDQTDTLKEELAIDIINAAGRARKWYKGDEVAKELLEKGLQRAKEAKYRWGEAFALNYLGSLLRDNGKPNEAIDYYQEALAIWKQLKEPLWIGNTYSNIAGCYQSQGMLPQAHKFAEQALAQHQESANERAILRSLSNMASLAYYEGYFSKAVEYSREAVQLANKLDNKLPPIDASNIEGIVLKRQGNLGEAKKFFQDSLKRLKAVEIPDSDKKYHIRSVKYNLAHSLELLGDYEGAINLHLELLHEEKQWEGPMFFPASYGLGRIAFAKGNLEEAIKYMEDAISKDESNDTHYVESLVLLSEAYIEQKDYKKARKLLDTALMVQIETKYAETVRLYGKGVLAQAERNLREARENFRRCIALADKIGLVEYKLRALVQIAFLDLFEYRISGSHESLHQMRTILSDAYTIAKSSGMLLRALEVRILKALSYSADFDYDEAINILEDSKVIAMKLGLDRKTMQIQELIDDIRLVRRKAMTSADPELSWDSTKVQEYLSNVQKLLRTFTKGREVS